MKAPGQRRAFSGKKLVLLNVGLVALVFGAFFLSENLTPAPKPPLKTAVFALTNGMNQVQVREALASFRLTRSGERITDIPPYAHFFQKGVTNGTILRYQGNSPTGLFFHENADLYFDTNDLIIAFDYSNPN